MSKLDPVTVRRYLAAKRTRELRAREAARRVWFELMSALERDVIPEIDPDIVSLSRQARPEGPFPSHATLLRCFEHELCTTPKP